MEILSFCDSMAGYHIATNCPLCYDVVAAIEYEWEQSEISIEFELRAKIVSAMNISMG